MLHESLLDYWIVFNCVFAVLKLWCTCLLNSFLLLLLLKFNLNGWVVVLQLLFKILLHFFRSCWVVKLIWTDVKISLSKIRSINMNCTILTLILCTKCSFSWSFVWQNCPFHLTELKVSFACSFSQIFNIVWFHRELVLIHNASKKFLCSRNMFEL